MGQGPCLYHGYPRPPCQPPFDFKTLEQHRGFFVYIAWTCPSLVPYLKGIHLTLDSWWPNQDSQGWKDHQQVQLHLSDISEEFPVNETCNHPTMVLPVPWLAADIQGLVTLFSSSSPRNYIIHSSAITVALFGFGDALGAGFGDTIITPSGVHYRYGIWGDDLQTHSSNYRELFNLTEAMEDGGSFSQLRFSTSEGICGCSGSRCHPGFVGMSGDFFTDNAVAKGAFCKGTSTNKQLFELVLKLKKLEFDCQFKLHVMHIAGHRMQAQGTDGLSHSSPFALTL
jgi:hypothetical protein